MDLLGHNYERAVFSDDRRYRYVLRRRWGRGANLVGFVLLNPSTADENADDPTVRRLVGYAKLWGYDGFDLANLFAFRATQPDDMKAAADPVGPENDAWIARLTSTCDRVVCGWGAHGNHLGRDAAVLALLRGRFVKPLAWKLTQAGLPGHPLYLPADIALQEMP